MVMQERFNVGGAMLVKLFGRPEAEAAAFEDKAGRVPRHRRRPGHLRAGLLRRPRASPPPWPPPSPTACGGVAAINGALQVGTVVALTAYLTRLYQPLTQLSNLNLDVMTALVSFERLFEVLDLVPDDPGGARRGRRPRGPAPRSSSTTSTSPTRAPSDVSLASLESVAILEAGGRSEVLHGISFRVEPGTMVALVGPSGAGKTTISSLVPRLYDVTAGSVRLSGIDVRQATMASLRDAVGVVTQDPHLFHDTLRANLLYARPEATEAEVLDALGQAQIGHIVADLPDGLDTVVGERGYRLSGGREAAGGPGPPAPQGARRRRARRGHRPPRLGVGGGGPAALSETLAGRTSLVIAHRLSTVREADQLLVIDDGRIVERGTHAELLAENGLYAELYRTQFADQEQEAEPAGA